MEYLRPKCENPALLTNDQKNPEVSLAEFAAIGGLSEPEYLKRLFNHLKSGNLIELLGLKAQFKLGEWIGEYFLDTGNKFVVVFRLSLNRVRDVTLFCVCSMDLTGEDAKINVESSIPGFIDAYPDETKGLPSMIFNFHDMEPSICQSK